MEMSGMRHHHHPPCPRTAPTGLQQQVGTQPQARRDEARQGFTRSKPPM